MDTGHFCIEALTEQGWKPVMTVNSIIFAIELVLYEPNLSLIPKNPINFEMAQLCQSNYHEFQWRVSETLKGGVFFKRFLFLPLYGEPNTRKRNRDGIDEVMRKMKRISISAEISMEIDPLSIN